MLTNQCTNIVNIRRQFLKLRGKVREFKAQSEATMKSKILKLHMALMEKTNQSVIPMPWKQWWYSLNWGQRSGWSDVRGFHNDTCAHLVGVAGGRGHHRVLAVGRRPAVSMVADEGSRVPCACHPEVGLVRGDEGGHAGERTCGNPENWCAVVSPPDFSDTLKVETMKRRRGRSQICVSTVSF